ncbi:hypothetical protein GCM10011321_38790 [Youhaiella tibetensis]|uniref:Flagellar hook protein FlgE n=1 Tax=Paradevosia tibetensis TaxID=1447062 RepID=A0A5B9DTV3_9HYPH|nr:flagellar hook protein FlgE [Youhaiella tibetensis]QEE22189.1 flagellar hook protein FlgE [Youhaiella tibetensis]GGF44519.1 hypothetical protein GCM10011321_38790 [Youhaiella tibetensis]
MRVEQFEDALDEYGADLAAWPPDLADAANRLLASDAEARDILEAERTISAAFAAPIRACRAVEPHPGGGPGRAAGPKPGSAATFLVANPWRAGPCRCRRHGLPLRNGEFSVDENGLLQSGGYYLQGWPTDADGNVVGGTTSTNLQTIDADAIATIAQPTSMAGLIANLPADADVGASFTSALEIYDSLGTAASTTITWTKTGENTWEASFSDPTLSSNASQTVGTVTSAAVAITFNSDGTLSTTNPSPPTLDVTWTTGGAASSITLDMGKAGTSSGLSQYATGSESPTVTVQTSQDGVGFGSLISIAIGDDGTVYANYDNGMQRSIYKVPVATFANANGLEAQSGGVYAETSKSGTCTLNISGTNGAGSVYGSQLELSTTDTNQEFARMMAAQQAYSGAAQVMTAAKDMYDTLMSAVR